MNLPEAIQPVITQLPRPWDKAQHRGQHYDAYIVEQVPATVDTRLD
jgi:hypothetical protein